jgi:hypothetical protein
VDGEKTADSETGELNVGCMYVSQGVEDDGDGVKDRYRRRGAVGDK